MRMMVDEEESRVSESAATQTDGEIEGERVAATDQETEARDSAGMLEQITPVILTLNEAPNIERSLERVSWAREIIVVDGFSDDETLEMVAKFPQARALQRDFDCLANQWNYAIHETGIRTPWVLALDADYILTPGLIDELKQLEPEDVAGYNARFVYCVNGTPLRGVAYPPVTVLYRREGARYEQDGHSKRVMIEGVVDELLAPILHDNRKPFDHWLASQAKYMELEKKRLIEAPTRDLGWVDRLRKMRIIAPFAITIYCLFIKGAIFDGKAGLYYTFQRLVTEAILSLRLIEHSLTGSTDDPIKTEKEDG